MAVVVVEVEAVEARAVDVDEDSRPSVVDRDGWN
jgi:hypothetical protein